MRLTKAEAKWIKDVQAVLDACPSKRLGFYTIGDAEVVIYDRTKEEKINELIDNIHSNKDFCTAVQETKADIGEGFRFPSCVHSTAG